MSNEKAQYCPPKIAKQELQELELIAHRGLIKIARNSRLSKEMNAWKQRAEKAESENERLRAFARDLFYAADWPWRGDIEGVVLQDLAVKHGLLRAETRHESCGEGCHCAKYCGKDELAEGVTCYRKVEWLK